MSAISITLDDFYGTITLVVNGVETSFGLHKLVDGATDIVDGQIQIMDGGL